MLEWTREEPTVPGWYWIKPRAHQDPEVVKLWGDGSLDWYDEPDRWYQFAGPIPEPTDPAREGE